MDKPVFLVLTEETWANGFRSILVCMNVLEIITIRPVAKHEVDKDSKVKTLVSTSRGTWCVVETAEEIRETMEDLGCTFVAVKKEAENRG